MGHHGFIGRENEREPDIFEIENDWHNYYEYIFNIEPYDVRNDSHLWTDPE